MVFDNDSNNSVGVPDQKSFFNYFENFKTFKIFKIFRIFEIYDCIFGQKGRLKSIKQGINETISEMNDDPEMGMERWGKDFEISFD